MSCMRCSGPYTSGSSMSAGLCGQCIAAEEMMRKRDKDYFTPPPKPVFREPVLHIHPLPDPFAKRQKW